LSYLGSRQSEVAVLALLVALTGLLMVPLMSCLLVAVAGLLANVLLGVVSLVLALTAGRVAGASRGAWFRWVACSSCRDPQV
jgi:hypothetical protein